MDTGMRGSEEVRVIVPVGPGRGESRKVTEALQALASEMRGHVKDLRGNGEQDQADLLERYSAALDLILEQVVVTGIVGIGLPSALERLAKKYHLEKPR